MLKNYPTPSPKKWWWWLNYCFRAQHPFGWKLLYYLFITYTQWAKSWRKRIHFSRASLHCYNCSETVHDEKKCSKIFDKNILGIHYHTTYTYLCQTFSHNSNYTYVIVHQAMSVGICFFKTLSIYNKVLKRFKKRI